VNTSPNPGAPGQRRALCTPSGPNAVGQVASWRPVIPIARRLPTRSIPAASAPCPMHGQSPSASEGHCSTQRRTGSTLSGFAFCIANVRLGVVNGQPAAVSALSSRPHGLILPVHRPAAPGEALLVGRSATYAAKAVQPRHARSRAEAPDSFTAPASSTADRHVFAVRWARSQAGCFADPHKTP